jgi:hypothetical protein
MVQRLTASLALLADRHPEIVRELTAIMESHQKTVEPFKNQIPLGRGLGAGPG